MGIYKLGYIEDLDNTWSWNVGKDYYKWFGGHVLPLDSKKMCRAIGYVSSISSGSYINCSGIINYPNVANTTFMEAVAAHKFETNEFNRGFVRFLSGGGRNKVYRVIGTTTTQLRVNTSVSGVGGGDYFEVVSGSCTFDFPADRNPINRVFKRSVVNKAQRFPFSQGSLVMFEGYQPDDFVLLVHLTNRKDADRLELILNHSLDYRGFDGPYSYDTIPGSDEGLAPMILETGVHDAENQYLVYINDYKIIRDAKYNDEFSEIMIHFLNYSGVIYRGV